MICQVGERDRLHHHGVKLTAVNHTIKNNRQEIMKRIWTFQQLILLLNQTACYCMLPDLLGTLLHGHFLDCFMYLFKPADSLISLLVFYTVGMPFTSLCSFVCIFGHTYLRYKIGLMNKKIAETTRSIFVHFLKNGFLKKL